MITKHQHTLHQRFFITDSSAVPIHLLQSEHPPEPAHRAGELCLQLLTLNTEAVDAAMREKVVAFMNTGGHIGASAALGWPVQYAQAFERVIATCLKAAPGSQTANLLRDSIVPGLLALRGDTLTSLFTSTAVSSGGSSAAPSAPPSVVEEAPQAPAAFRCPLTQQVMLDPVLAGDGFIYERSAIEQWLAVGRKVSPMTNDPLPHTFLTAQSQLRVSIEAWLRAQSAASAPVFA